MLQWHLIIFAFFFFIKWQSDLKIYIDILPFFIKLFLSHFHHIFIYFSSYFSSKILFFILLYFSSFASYFSDRKSAIGIHRIPFIFCIERYSSTWSIATQNKTYHYNGLYSKEVLSLEFKLLWGFSFYSTWWRILTLSLPELSVELHDELQVQANSSWPWIDPDDLTPAKVTDDHCMK